MDKSNQEKLSIGIPMVWREHKKHVDDYYICLKETSAYCKKTRQKLSYPILI